VSRRAAGGRSSLGKALKAIPSASSHPEQRLLMVIQQQRHGNASNDPLFLASLKVFGGSPSRQQKIEKIPVNPEP
jgi:hypothetical protein